MNRNIKRFVILAMLTIEFSFSYAQQLSNPALNVPESAAPNSGQASLPGLINFATPNAYNYIRVQIPDRPSTTEGTAFVRQSTTYYDGLARPLQTVNKCALGTYADLVQPRVYDTLGRESMLYQPYMHDLTNTVLSLSAGKFHLPVLTTLQNFYNGSPGEEPYSKMALEGSPLNRILKSYYPGHSWVGLDRGVQNTYQFNLSTENVRIWTIGNNVSDLPVSNSAYTNGVLYKKVVTDEDGKITIAYSDKLNRVILKKSTITNSPSGQHSGYACTYYVYDGKGNLRYSIPPAAVAAIDGSWNISAVTELCYSFFYDSWGRKVEEKVAGKQVEYYVYDKRGRLAFYQNGFLRSQNNAWEFTIYDALNRQLERGIYTGSENRVSLQGYFNDPNTYAPPSVIYYQKQYGVYNSYPSVMTGCKILSYSYYDNYAQLSNFNFDASQFNNIPLPGDGTVVPSALNLNTQGQLTGTKILILDPQNPNGNNWITTAIFYDVKNRPIQTQTSNIKTGLDINSNIYFFQGMIWKNIMRHQNPFAKPIPGAGDTHLSFKVQTNSNYNLLSGGGTNQLRGTTMQIDDGIVYQLANYWYDQMGRVVTTQTPAANMLHEYNVRGLLNHIDVSNSNNTADSVHIFEENIYYDKGFGNKLYNGNIAGVTWRGAGSLADTQAYGYSYDLQNRLTHAEYRYKDNGSWSNTATNYTASNMSYDINGNLMSMNQMGPGSGAPSMMDQLTYTYAANSNKLIKVEDAIPAATTAALGLPDFKNGADSLTEYYYDDNGNLTKDRNKKITSVTYNYLNRPEVITLQNQGTISFMYDADGNTLRKIVHTNATNSDAIYDYIGNFVYKNDTLQYLLTTEGRARPVVSNSITKFVFDYFIKDHLGNVRSTVTAEPMDYPYLAGMEISQANIEQLVFDNIPNVRDAKPGGSGNDHMAARLNGGEADRRIGTAIMLNAMPGDRFTISAEAYYEGDYRQTDEVGSDAVVSSLVNALMGGTNYDGVPISELPKNVRTVQQVFANPDLASQLEALVANTNNPEAPRAHLNILFFNNKMELVPSASHIIQVGGSAPNATSIWQILHPENNGGGTQPICCIMPEGGTVIVYVDNQSVGKDVYFDNISIEHYTGRVQEETHYYPYGLSLSPNTGNNITPNEHKFNGITLIKDLGLEMNNAYFRDQDPQLGRFWQIDPKYTFEMSPYSSMGNNPTVMSDPLGDTTVVYGRNGQLIMTIYDKLPNQIHFLDMDGDASKAFEVKGSAAELTGTMARSLSIAFIGENSAKSLEALSLKSANTDNQEFQSGEEYGFYGEISSSKEIIYKRWPLPDGVRGDFQEYPIAKAFAEFKKRGGNSSNVFLEGHTHVKGWTRTIGNAGNKEFDRKWALTYYSRPSDGADYKSATGKDIPLIIASPVGMTIFNAQKYYENKNVFDYKWFKTKK